MDPAGALTADPASLRSLRPHSIVEPRRNGHVRAADGHGALAPFPAAAPPLLERHPAARPILEHHDPLVLVADAIRESLGGDFRPAMLTYLSATTRLLAPHRGSMPCHLLLLGAAGTGKSATASIVRHLLQPEAFLEIDAGSPHVLIYDTSPLEHRVVFFGEADSLPAGEDNPAASAVRNLMADGRLHYQVVAPQRGSDRLIVRDIVRPGPTVLITTATHPLGDQLMSRLFVIDMPDYHHQREQILVAQAQLELDGDPPRHDSLVTFQAHLQDLAPIAVVVPFARELAGALGRMPTDSRVTRDYGKLLALVKAVATSRLAHRRCDEQGRVVATLDDYRTIVDLAGAQFAASHDDVGKTTRETVEAVEVLLTLLHPDIPVTVDFVARHMKIHKSNASRHVAAAVADGWLINRQSRRGRPANLILGNQLPSMARLPDPESLGAPEVPPVSPATAQPVLRSTVAD